MQQLGAVGLVLIMLWGTAWLLKRKAGTPFISPRAKRGMRHIEELDRARLTPQHSVHLVRIDERTLLLAVHPGGVVMLDGGNPVLDPQFSTRLRYEEK